ncbi:hypothetical protein [Paludisphaera borealis]|uniref:Uncharacterized protein n=1 Tax=Paludisphaera borealis TaxID=1387353 RepID=A0A1U7CJM7_9BACT|nr:hypothetical protein [Paludisphaera borealis]APW59107.1 hypothetical protein BSF38_00521 [Paludisphaera borealis]
MILSPERLLELIDRSRQEHAGQSVVAFWYQMPRDREGFAERICARRGDLPVVPLVVREGFQHGNAIMGDLCRLIERNRERIESVPRSGLGDDSPLVLLLLSVEPFQLNQISSFVALPEWFPMQGGLNSTIDVEDLFWTARSGLDAEESRIDEIQEMLCRIDLALANQLAWTHTHDKEAHKAFFDLIRQPTDKKRDPAAATSGPEKYADLLLYALAFCEQQMQSARSYRPSAREGRSIVARLIRLGYKTTPDNARDVGKKLACALGVLADVVPPSDALTTILSRPTNPEKDPATRFGMNLFATVFAAAQFVTSAHHSAEYPPYPTALLQAFSFNLRQTLDALIQALEDRKRGYS